MPLDILEPRTEPRWPAPSPHRPALTAARPARLALPPERSTPAAHAPSQAWAAPLFDETAGAYARDAALEILTSP